MTPTSRRLWATDNDGSLTKELQSCDRLGVDSRQGIVFRRVAEIGLLGGLGCGGVLVRKALAKLRDMDDFDFVVLQSTKMAISFYEQLGFKRVGAVTRFRDNESLPEVPYRHWSEIVDGEAVEASYMMALRLEEKPPRDIGGANLAGCEIIPTNTTGSVPDSLRKGEILSALSSAFLLLMEALFIRARGTTTYNNSYRELLATAREFALSANDTQLTKNINQAMRQFSGTLIRRSKNTLREILEMSNTKVKVGPILRQSLLHSVSEHMGFQLNRQLKDFVVSIKVNKTLYWPLINGHSRLYATIPVTKEQLVSTISTKPDDFVRRKMNVSITVEGQRFCLSPEIEILDGTPLPPLMAFLQMPARENAEDLRDSVVTALDNLATFIPATMDAVHSQSRAAVHPGDSIMLKVPGYDGSPLWLPVSVERQCKRYEIPDNDCATKSNSFVVKLVEPCGTQRLSRVLDLSNRGVGREWATQTDWFSFSVLPARILDKILIGSWVQYPAEDGEVREGYVTRCIGGGLNSVPRWRLTICAENRVSRGANGPDKEAHKVAGNEEIYEDLEAGALREAVNVSNSNMRGALSLLQTMGPPFFGGLDYNSSTEYNGEGESPIKYFAENSDNDRQLLKDNRISGEEQISPEINRMKSDSLRKGDATGYAMKWAACRFKLYELGSVDNKNVGTKGLKRKRLMQSSRGCVSKIKFNKEEREFESKSSVVNKSLMEDDMDSSKTTYCRQRRVHVRSERLRGAHSKEPRPTLVEREGDDYEIDQEGSFTSLSSLTMGSEKAA